MASENCKPLRDKYIKRIGFHEDRLRVLHQRYYSSIPQDFTEFCEWISKITVEKYDLVASTKRRIEDIENEIFETRVKRPSKRAKQTDVRRLEFIYGKDVEAGNVFVYCPNMAQEIEGAATCTIVSKRSVTLYHYIPKDKKFENEIAVSSMATYKAIEDKLKMSCTKSKEKIRPARLLQPDRKPNLTENDYVKMLQKKILDGSKKIVECHKVCKSLGNEVVPKDLGDFTREIIDEVKKRQGYGEDEYDVSVGTKFTLSHFKITSNTYDKILHNFVLFLCCFRISGNI